MIARKIFEKAKYMYGKYSRASLGIVIKKAPYRVLKPISRWTGKFLSKFETRAYESVWFLSFKPSCSFFFSLRDREQYIALINESGSRQTVIEAAERICRHEFDILGSGYRFLGDPITWTADFKTGYVWRNQYYQDIKTVNPSHDADVKIPWELSRCHQFFVLGEAYWLSGDPKYVLEFQNQCQSWIESNPFEMSVNWVCPMEAAIRAMNWIAGYCFFQETPVISGDFWTQFHRTLYLHGRFIFNNLENRGINTNNHYIADLVGLIWLGLFFRNLVPLRNGRNNPVHWLRWGMKVLEKEMSIQINPDGTDYETSTHYHRLVAEMLVLTCIFCGRNQLRFTDESPRRLERMGEFLADIVKPSGKIPVIGDTDDGRIFDITRVIEDGRVATHDFRFVLALMGEYFGRNDFRHMGSPYRDEAVLFIGTGGALREDRPPSFQSKAYRDGGFYILRNANVYCIVRCGPLSCRGEGGHSHNDQLSVEVNILGEDFFIDPGTGVYSADFDLRNRYRSTHSHNTLSIEGSEQNDFNPHDLFFMREQTFAECLTFTEEQFVGRHFGYQKKHGAIHQRRVETSPSGMLIVDSLEPGMPHFEAVNLNFILAPDVTVKLNGNEAYLEKGCAALVMKTTGVIKSDAFSISPGYGVLVPSWKLTVENSFKDGCHSTITIQIL